MAPMVAGFPRTSQSHEPMRKTKFPLAAIILIGILVFAVIIAVVILLPFQPVEFSQQNEASAANVNSLYFSLEADITDINVHFMDLPANQKVQLNTSATGRKSILSPEKPVALSFQEDTANSTLVYIVKISRTENTSLLHQVTVTCDVYIDPSVSLDLNLRTSTGEININADKAMTINRLTAESSTGTVQATLAEDVIVSGSMTFRTITGVSSLSWNNADASSNIPVYLSSLTGGVELTVNQSKPLSANVTINADTSSAGYVTLNLGLRNEVAANISATQNTGSIFVQQRGFSGNELPIQSSNYPSQSNFMINLQNNAGGTEIHAAYEFTNTRS